jgi:hypothetical protein
LIRSPLSTTSVLDEATELVPMTSSWVGLLILTTLPYRFLQALFVDQLIEVGDKAPSYGNLLGGTASMIVGAIVVAVWGRTVYARACRLAHGRGTPPGRETWRVPAAMLASYLLTSATMILIGYLSVFTCIGVVVAAIFSGLAIGTAELNERVSVVEPFRLIVRHARTATPMALVFVFFCAFFVAFVNLAAAFGIGIWAVSALGDFDAPRWQLLFTGNNRRYVLMLVAGAMVAIEPFWIAAQVVFVRKAGAEERGDDLRAWFEELERAS